MRLLCLFAALLFVAPMSANAQDADRYPNKPIRVIVPFAPGGATDITMRMIQPVLTERLGQQLIVDNRGGAAGNIGMEVASRATPDGYTLFLGNVGTVAINPSFYKDLTVVPERDFIPISLASETAGVVVASTKFPPNSLKEMVAYVKAHPGKINYASSGISSQNTLEMEQFRKAAGLDMLMVPYKGGAGPALNDLVAGHVDVMFVTFSAAFGHVMSGKLKALAVTTGNRLPELPQVATMAEQGFPENVSSSWQGLFAIAGTPQPIVAKLHAAMIETMKDERTRKLMTDAGMIPNSSRSPEAFKAFVIGETAKWKGVIQSTGLKLE